ncbi:MAG: AAA family ATPase [Acidimicrobiales bacterium]
MDGDLEAEQAHVDRAYTWLGWMRARAEWLVAGTDPLDLDVLHALRRRAASLTDGGRPLCFGRIDGEDGETFHIGRRHVEDDRSEPVVVEWRAPVAVPFYRATPTAPLGLTRRRQFIVDGRRVQSVAEDLFGPGGGGAVARLRGGDALLAELERSRGAEMLDIVATIQSEQDEVIRSPRDGVLICQGGPGSGKTAVGLHRAAFLLYGDETLARQGVLVLGPNRVFLRYIAQVLPSLGEEAVVQTTVRDLAANVRVVAADDLCTERIKGDVRMASVIREAVALGRRPVDDDVVVAVGLRRLTLSAQDANAIARDVTRRRVSYDAGRGMLRDGLISDLVARHPGAGSEEYATVERAVRSAPAVGAALDRLWPSVSPGALVRALVTKKAVLGRAAEGILDAAEQRDLLRPATATESLDMPGTGIAPPAWELRRQAAIPRKVRRRDPWTAADVALLDEAIAVVSGEGRTYGHVVVDEAQDLSPMQLRMIARRSPTGSVSLLGDLAQASGAWAPESWDEVAAHLSTPNGWRLAELRLGYRSPGDVLDFAARLLAFAAPNVTPPEAVRPRRGGVEVVDASTDYSSAVTAHAAALADRYPSVAVVTDAPQVGDLEKALQAVGIDAARAEDAGGLSRRVAVVDALQAKGLEFDAVVVADPAAIVASALDEARGMRLLYVALTRPTQALVVVHREISRHPSRGGGSEGPTGVRGRDDDRGHGRRSRRRP